MLRSNPSADFSGLDRSGGATASPFRNLLAETPYRARHQSVKSWRCGGKAPCCAATKISSDARRSLILHGRFNSYAKLYAAITSIGTSFMIDTQPSITGL
jgi:hypothetical protein